MSEEIARLKRRGRLVARMDCLVRGEMHWCSWLGIPLVRTQEIPGMPRMWDLKYVPAWVGNLVSTSPSKPRNKTMIDTLWIDIRLFPDEPGKRRGVESPRDRTSWAVCAALKHVFEHDPEIVPVRSCMNVVEVGEVVLNVLPHISAPLQPQPAMTGTSGEGENSANTKADQVDPEAVAKELVDVWNKLWSGEEFKARYYRTLLEKIEKVRVCVDGETRRVRGLRGELERGRGERRRIDMRYALT